MPKNRFCKALALALCVFLVLSCLFGTLLSHDHQCSDNDCLVCCLIDLFKSVFIAVIVSVTVIESVRNENATFDEKQLDIKGETPVMRKVKLTP